MTCRKVTGYIPTIQHGPVVNATPSLKNYQPMDMSGQRARIPVYTNSPVSSSYPVRTYFTVTIITDFQFWVDYIGLVAIRRLRKFLLKYNVTCRLC